MSVREEGEKNKECPSRGLGLAAAAAFGVGVGAALYYYFNKRQENPDSAGATTSGWTCENNVPLSSHENSVEESSSYITVSQHSTSDTSINDMSGMSSSAFNSSASGSDDEDTEDNTPSDNISLSTDNYTAPESDTSVSEFDSVMSEYGSSYVHSSASPYDLDDSASEDLSQIDEVDRGGVVTLGNSISFMVNNITEDENSREGHIGSDEEFTYTPSSQSSISSMEFDDSVADGEWDVIDRFADIPTVQDRFRRIRVILFEGVFDSEQNIDENLRASRTQAFRERSWTLEECSICFDVMLTGQELMSLPCTHNFHTQCILPWLQERQNCPVCRKNA